MVKIAAMIQHCTEVRFASFLSGGLTTLAVINPPERKLAKHTSVHWCDGHCVMTTVRGPLSDKMKAIIAMLASKIIELE